MSQVEPAAPARLEAGEEAPDFTLPAHDGTTVRLADLRGSKVVVYFYPAAMTPGCTTQACDFRDNLASLQAAGYRVLGVSPDPVDRLAAFAERDSLTFPLLSDADRSVMTRWGAFGEKKLYGKVVTGVIRSTVVLDEAGVVTLARYNVKATGHVASLRKALGVD
jgi:thioredoxin-dependent peroxiredoxin